MRHTLLRRASVRHLAAVAALAGGLFAAATPAVATAAVATAAAPASVSQAVRARAYPYARSNPDNIDPWGNYYRQCTSFAAWYLTSHGVHITAMGKLSGPKGSAALGDAKNWDRAAKAAGYKVSSKPVVGAIAQWHANERTSFAIPHGMAYFQAADTGHVGVVTKVFSDGSVQITDYNGAVSLGQHTFRGKAPRYLLIHM